MKKSNHQFYNVYRSTLEKEPFLRYDRTSFSGRLVEISEKNAVSMIRVGAMDLY